MLIILLHARQQPPVVALLRQQVAQGLDRSGTPSHKRGCRVMACDSNPAAVLLSAHTHSHTLASVR